MPDTPSEQQPDVNPKAAAKAAKAYAKATRPWYKKKRFILPIALVLLIVIISAASSGDETDNTAEKVSGQSSAGQKTTDEKATDTPTVFRVGDTVKLAGTQYTVTSARTSPTVGDNEFTRETADGIFIVVDLTIENVKDETKTFSSSSVNVVAGNGKSYSPDNDGTFAVLGSGGESLLIADMQPDVPKSGTIVFDVPADATAGSKLVVSDFWGDGEASIALGLK